MNTNTQRLRELADDYESWCQGGCQMLDPNDTYPNELYDMATRPASILALLDELDNLRAFKNAVVAVVEASTEQTKS